MNRPALELPPLTRGQSRGYVLQGIAIPLWWSLMILSPPVEAIFLFSGLPPLALYGFLLPDLLLIAGASLLHRFRPNRFLPPVIFGAVAYGTLWCLLVSSWTRSGWLGTLIMFLTTAINFLWMLGPNAFRRSRQAPTRRHHLATSLQSVVIWGFTLLILPVLLLHAFDAWPPTFHPVTTALAILLFLAGSALGLRSGWVMAERGHGTPLPLDTARDLVTSGPYAWIRNPMAVAGLGQGLAVALLCQSWILVGYVLLGMGVWNYLIRPDEEAFLEATFGQAYLDYQKRVRCWLPKS